MRDINRSTPVLLLLYHRVYSPGSDPQLLCVDPENFSGHMHYIATNFSPIRLEDWDFSVESSLPRIAVTFDDGYADNIVAAGILERYEVPATIFLATGTVGTDREFWWDDLERLLLLPRVLPDRLAMVVHDREYSWTGLTHPGERDRADWNVMKTHERSARQNAYVEIFSLIKPLAFESREALLRQLAGWAGIEMSGREDYRTMDREELRGMARRGHISMGAHTVNHPSLLGQDSRCQEREITESRLFLEKVTSSPVTSFSYPYGSTDDFDSGTVEIVRQAGFSRSCTTEPARVRPSTDPFRLPRFLVRNWPVEEFSKRVEQWLE